jgi:hypothetical protein
MAKRAHAALLGLALGFAAAPSAAEDAPSADGAKPSPDPDAKRRAWSWSMSTRCPKVTSGSPAEGDAERRSGFTQPPTVKVDVVEQVQRSQKLRPPPVTGSRRLHCEKETSRDRSRSSP